MTLIPLLAMVIAAKRIEYGTLGFLQYITPIGRFSIAIFVYGEVISLEIGLVFITTWIALAPYMLGSIGPVASPAIPFNIIASERK